MVGSALVFCSHVGVIFNFRILYVAVVTKLLIQVHYLLRLDEVLYSSFLKQWAYTVLIHAFFFIPSIYIYMFWLFDKFFFYWSCVLVLIWAFVIDGIFYRPVANWHCFWKPIDSVQSCWIFVFFFYNGWIFVFVQEF